MAEGNKKGVPFIVAGAVLAVLAIAADGLGIGANPGFGPKQTILLIVGIGLLGWGLKSCKCSGGADSSPPSA